MKFTGIKAIIVTFFLAFMTIAYTAELRIYAADIDTDGTITYFLDEKNIYTQEFSIGNEVTLVNTSKMYDLEGFHFIAWSTEPGGLGHIYEDGDTIVPDGDLKLYAITMTQYYIYIDQNYEHGEVVNKTELFTPGEIAFVSLKPDDGYRGSIEVISEDGNTVPYWHSTYGIINDSDDFEEGADEPPYSGNPSDKPKEYWENEYNFEMPEQNVTVYATFSRKDPLTVTWMDGETVLEKDEHVGEGSLPSYDSQDPTRSKDDQYSYTFSGWSQTLGSDEGISENELPPVMDSRVYYAVFTQSLNQYQVVFTDGVGTDLKTETVNYGDSATAPDEPVREGFSFDGWDAEYDFITNDTTVNAKWITEQSVVYENISSESEEYVINSGELLKFTIERSTNNETAIEHYIGAKLDNTFLTSDQCTVYSGSIVVELKPIFLDTLSPGKHVLTVMFDDSDDLETEFIVTKPDSKEDNTSSNPASATDSSEITDGKQPQSQIGEKEETGEDTSSTEELDDSDEEDSGTGIKDERPLDQDKKKEKANNKKTTKSESSSNSPKTGDYSNWKLWLIILIISLQSTFICIWLRFREKI